ncbi:PQQ-binding-like beta-propeller repeat protein [Bremerella sp. T1]|uniref:PQQ-binding-like beta-propeller repeat protein n=1 Tax=Bremerella sp. TYQ1 TaxID=3119568 RepID=UPI001CCB339C|nr:PQQ-binding-like beta-propeller repeat protein [Bremerella volcania]UBM37792.1 PQQ-like beta-propeller repeat protein [Bremerella volcania]
MLVWVRSLLATYLFLVGMNAPALLFAEEWPTFLGPRHNSTSSETGLQVPWPKDGPKILWQRKLGTGYGIGSIADGKFYQFDRHGDQNRLEVLAVTTGDKIWQYEYPTQYEDALGYNNGPRCSPVIDDDRVYIYGAEGELHCLSTKERKLLWKRNLSADFNVVPNFFGVGSTPVIFKDKLLVMVGGSPEEFKGLGPYDIGRVDGNGSGIVALDKKSGKTIYQISDELASYASLTLAEIDGRPWCFAFLRGGLLAFDPRDGKIDFHYPWRAKKLESVNASTPVVVGDEVFISECYSLGSTLLKVKPGGYEVVWKDEERSRDHAMETHWNTAVYADGFLYGSSGRHTHQAELRCIDWKTGEIQWAESGLTRSSLLLVEDYLLCLSEYGMLRLLKANPKAYEVISEVELTDDRGNKLLKPPAWAAPILSDGRLFVRGDDRLVCLEVIPPGNQ